MGLLPCVLFRNKQSSLLLCRRRRSPRAAAQDGLGAHALLRVVLARSIARRQRLHENADNIVSPALEGTPQLVLLPAAAFQEAVISLCAVGFLLTLVPQTLILAFQLADPPLVLLRALFVLRDLCRSLVRYVSCRVCSTHKGGGWVA